MTISFKLQQNASTFAYSHRSLQWASLNVVPRHNILNFSEQRTDSLKLTSDLIHAVMASVGVGVCMGTRGGKEIKHNFKCK